MVSPQMMSLLHVTGVFSELKDAARRFNHPVADKVSQTCFTHDVRQCVSNHDASVRLSLCTYAFE